MLANMHPAASALLSQFSKPSLNDLVPILEVLLCTAAVSSLGWGGWQLWRKFGRRSRQDPRQVPSAEEAKIWKRNEKISIFLLQKQVDSNPDLREALHKAGIPITIHTLSEDPTASTPRTPASLGMVERAELDAWRNATPADRETMKNHWARQNGDRALDPDNLSSFQKAVLIGEDAGPNDNDTDGNVPRPSTVPSEENDTIIESIENRAVQSAHDIATALAKDESSVRRIRRAFELHHSNGTGPSRVAGQKRRSLEAIDEEEEESPRSRGVETPTPKGNAEEMDIDDEAEEDLVTTSQANRMDPAWRAENLTGTRSTRSAGRTTVSKLNLGSIPKLTAKDRTDTKIPVKRASQEPQASSSSSSTGLGNIPKLDPKRTTTNSRPAKRARTSQEPHDSIADMNKAHSPTRRSRSASARKTSVAPTPSRRSSRLASKEVGNMNLTQMSRRSARQPGAA
jgi:hypothetical protein